MPRRLRYHVATSLDGFIADQDGGYDWLIHDAAIDFPALYRQFDTAIMGRKTYDVMRAQGSDGSLPGLDVIVFSRTLPPTRRAGLRITADDPASVVRKLKAAPGGDIWLFGGGELFRALHDASLVDTVELAVMPIVPGSGIIALSYVVEGSGARPAPIEYVKPAAGMPAARKRSASTRAAGRGRATPKRSTTPARPRKRR
jgi:dihydrofolate reductase